MLELKPGAGMCSISLTTSEGGNRTQTLPQPCRTRCCDIPGSCPGKGSAARAGMGWLGAGSLPTPAALSPQLLLSWISFPGTPHTVLLFRTSP